MVADIRPSRQSIEGLVTWCTSLYAVHARVACSIMRKHVPLLDKYPAFRDKLEQFLIEVYERYFAELARDVTLTAEGIVEHKFRTLKLDEIMSLIQLLVCSGLTKSMMSSRDAPIPIKDEDLERVKAALGANNISVDQELKFAMRVACSPERHTHHVFDYFADCATVSFEDYASGNSLFLHAINESDVGKHLNDINKTVHMIRRFSCGLIFMEFQSLIEDRIVCTVQQVNHTFSNIVTPVITDLLNDEARLALFKDDGTRLQTLKASKEELEDCFKAISALNKCKLMPPIDVSRPMDLLRRMEERESVLQRNVDMRQRVPEQPLRCARIPLAPHERRALTRAEVLTSISEPQKYSRVPQVNSQMNELEELKRWHADQNAIIARQNASVLVLEKKIQELQCQVQHGKEEAELKLQQQVFECESLLRHNYELEAQLLAIQYHEELMVHFIDHKKNQMARIELECKNARDAAEIALQDITTKDIEIQALTLREQESRAIAEKALQDVATLTMLNTG
eukprot:PhF_6_TR30177/c1_g1_i1/m.44304